MGQNGREVERSIQHKESNEDVGLGPRAQYNRVRSSITLGSRARRQGPVITRSKSGGRKEVERPRYNTYGRRAFDSNIKRSLYVERRDTPRAVPSLFTPPPLFRWRTRTALC